MIVIIFIVSILASMIGAICGVGGGVIMKPLLDAMGIMSISTVSFLSGCTVLGMSTYAVWRSCRAGDSLIDFKIGTPLSIGAAVGGIIGKQLFQFILSSVNNKDCIGAVQAACLIMITAATLIYMNNKQKIRSYHVEKAYLCIIFGVILGVMSSFLGIGGGPINLAILFYFFSMDMKTAAQNSLYIILFSQITSLASSIITKTVPEYSIKVLTVMIAGGVFGGIVGRMVNDKVNETHIQRLFNALLVVIIGINIYNVFRFT